MDKLTLHPNKDFNITFHKVIVRIVINLVDMIVNKEIDNNGLPDYEALIPYKVRDIIGYIMKNNGLSFIDAIEYLYSSETYKYLVIEETKLWHLSPWGLYDWLEEEKRNTYFEFPEVL
jgi:hypothetical protein